MSSDASLKSHGPRATVLASRPLMAWRTIDLMTAALIGVSMGIVFWGWNLTYEFISAPFTAALAPLVGLLGGTWLLAGVLGGLIVRRPGAALLAELVAAAVSALLGNQWGWTTLYSGLLQGLGVELVLLVFAYRRFGLGVAMLAGAMAAAFETAYEWNMYWTDWNPDWKLIYLGCFMLSGAVIAGIGGWLITRALARTGAIDALPPGQEAHRHSAV
jgi:energy-coupling factor transport system substrate-specific component